MVYSTKLPKRRTIICRYCPVGCVVCIHQVTADEVDLGLGIPAEPRFRSCGRRRHLARKLSLRKKRSSPNVFEMAATETITSIILIKLIRVSFGTVRRPRRFKIGREVQQECRDRGQFRMRSYG